MLRTGSTGAQALAAQPLLRSPHSLQQLPLLREPRIFSCSRTHLAPGHSASPGPAPSCGKICSWTQNHTVLEQKSRCSVRAAHARSSPVNVHATQDPLHLRARHTGPSPSLPPRQTRIPGLCRTASGWLTKELPELRQLFLPQKNSPVCRNFRQGFLVCSSCRIAAASWGDKGQTKVKISCAATPHRIVAPNRSVA